MILNNDISGRGPRPLQPEELWTFLADTPWEQPMLAAMKRRDKVTRYGKIDVRVEDYFLKMVDRAHECNVPIADDLKWLLGDEPDGATVITAVDETTVP